MKCSICNKTLVCGSHGTLGINSESLWENDKVQFARLINELDLLGIFTISTLTDVANETDLSQAEILDLIDRAKNVYDETLEQLEGRA